MSTPRFALAALSAGALFALAACNNDSGEELTWSAEITSVDQFLHQANSDDSALYGWNRIVGETEIDGETVEVEMLGTVDYVDGNGPFRGFITLTFPGGDTLALSQDGEAEAEPDTTRADLSADLDVIGGTGRYLDATGDGQWEGFRDEALGGEVHMDVTLDVELLE